MIAATAATHCTEAFPDKGSARVASRRLRMSRCIATSPAYCLACEAWHLQSTDRRVSNGDRAILFVLAMGLRTAEIARDLNQPENAIVRRIASMMETFDAISRPNLVILATWFGVIDPRPIAFPVNERGPASSAGGRSSVLAGAGAAPSETRPRTPAPQRALRARRRAPMASAGAATRRAAYAGKPGCTQPNTSASVATWLR